MTKTLLRRWRTAMGKVRAGRKHEKSPKTKSMGLREGESDTVAVSYGGAGQAAMVLPVVGTGALGQGIPDASGKTTEIDFRLPGLIQIADCLAEVVGILILEFAFYTCARK